MVFQGGFEPPTPALGGRCSIQLSYWNEISPCGYRSTRATARNSRRASLEDKGPAPHEQSEQSSELNLIISIVLSPRGACGIPCWSTGPSKGGQPCFYLAINTLSKKSAASWLVLTILENVDAFFKSFLAKRSTVYSSSS